MVVLGEGISQPPYILGNFPRIEIVFAAIDKPKIQREIDRLKNAIFTISVSHRSPEAKIECV